MSWKLSVPATLITALMAWFAYDTAETLTTCQQQVVQKVNARIVNRNDRQDFMGSAECTKMMATAKVIQAFSQSAH